jgi:LmbE family N-acetylglucosaminyl deacetylase
VAHRESLGLPDSRLETSVAQKDVVVEAIRRLQPRVVLLPHWEQRHPDHTVASRLVYEASFLAGLKNYRPDLGAAFRPFKLIYALTVTESVDVFPTFVVDITPMWDKKVRAVAAFASQFPAHRDDEGLSPLDLFQRHMEIAARRQGQRIGVDYGEGYVTREPMAVSDVATLTVRSL